MRRFCLVVWLALESGCSSYRVRCDSHLRPINPSGATQVSQSPADTSAEGVGASARNPEASGSP
jgi:hypothetical protein